MGAKVVAMDRRRMSANVEVAVKIDMLLEDGFCYTRELLVKQSMFSLLNLFDVDFTVTYTNGKYIFKLKDGV